jgi:DNA polymerase
MFVGISSQKNKWNKTFMPFDNQTNSGKLLEEIILSLPKISFHKTNLIKCAPLNELGKIRYPTKEEYKNCFKNFEDELNIVKPKLIFIFGNPAIKAIEQKYKIKLEKEKPTSYKNLNFVAINHPSYIMIYKRKNLEEYKDKIKGLITIAL